jgi:hypothetical protein
LRISRDILVSFGEHFDVKKISLDRHSPVAAKSTSDDSIRLAEAVYRFVPVVVNGRNSNYNCGVPLVKFPIRKGSLSFDVIAIEYVSTPNTYNWLVVQRHERCWI